MKAHSHAPRPSAAPLRTAPDAKVRRSKKAAARPRRVIFTIVSANYISYAATLMQSVREHHPEAARYIVLADRMRDFPGLDLAAELIGCEQLGIGLLDNMKLWYTVIEINTAIKPFAFRYFFGEPGFAQACYIDPDILLFRPMAEVFAALETHSAVLTPHMMHPLQDGKEPSDLTIMKSGVYNLGFLALANNADANRLVDWWADRCFTQCRVDIAGHLFTDQRWMDLAPAFLEKPFILRHQGYNVAYWNIVHRNVHQAGDEWRVDDKPLVFFHFSGITPEDPQSFSKHQNRFTIATLGPAAELCGRYRALVFANGWSANSRLRYAFAQFPDGRPIEDSMRRWICRNVEQKRIDPREPLAIGSDFFDAEDEEAAQRGAPRLTRLMYQLWLDRPDLRNAFDIFAPPGREAYLDWFLRGEARRQGVDQRSIAAAAMLGGRHISEVWSPASPKTAPWPPAAVEHWPGPASSAPDMMRAEREVTIGRRTALVPLQAALAWENRRDLQGAFSGDSIDNIDDYLGWVLTNGIAEKAIDPGLLTGRFVAHMAETLALSAHYRDVPVTRGLLITRHATMRRAGLDGWQRFPVERRGRLAHGLWFAYAAPDEFNWPEDLHAPLRRHFDEPSEITCDGFALTRGALALREIRPHIEQAYPLTDERARWRFLRWLVFDGLRELGLELDQFDPRLRGFLASESPRLPGISQVLEMAHDSRPDLQAAFDVQTEEGRQGLLAWGGVHFLRTYWNTPARAVLDQPTEFACDGFALSEAEIALWRSRPDLLQAFPFGSEASCRDFLRWLVFVGYRELGLPLDQFDPRLPEFLRSESPRVPGVSQILEMAREIRPDLQDAFDLGTEEGRTGLIGWAGLNFRTSWPDNPVSALVAGGAAALLDGRPHRAAIALSGFWSSPTGRGEDVRGSVRALQEIGFTDYVVCDFDTGRILRADGSPLPAGTALDVACNIVHANADTAARDWAMMRRMRITAGKTVGFWAWELETLPSYWRHAFSFYDEVWAATRFAETAFDREQARPVRLVPAAVHLPPLGREVPRSQLMIPERATVFLFMFDFRSYVTRKNPEAVIDAFRRAFPTGDETAHLLIKTQGAAGAPSQWRKLKQLCTDPRIAIRDVELDRVELLNLVRACDCFVSLHRSEGFGRGPAEAMLLGKPCIVTDYSGTADFATAETAYLASYRPVPVGRDEYPGAEGQSWADADIDSAADAMRRIHTRPEEAQAIGARGRAQIRRLYAPETVGRRILDAVAELTGRDELRPDAGASGPLLAEAS